MTTNTETISFFSLALDRQPGLVSRKKTSIRRGMLLGGTPPGWNVLALSQNDFYQYCDQAAIKLHEITIECHGVYLVCNGRPYIFISDKLRGAEKTFVCFHEIGHFWLHKPGDQFSADGKRPSRWANAIEIEADIVAVCAMIPLTVLKRHRPGEIADLYGYAPELVRLRQEVFDCWQI